ncbi:MAG: DUF4918 family protein [Cyclobacteriaceae bacterium]|nr:DUF4918 family protein [Cyclobacteriaceae bacterium]
MLAAMMLADHILEFLHGLKIDVAVPRGVEVLNPYQQPEVFGLCKSFYSRYYGDSNSRTLIIGINPGRFGGGLTGIPFTDPIRLQQVCGIPNTLPSKPELSSDFIYRMIAAFGGATRFYKNFYFTSVSPLGFTFNQKNLNYYDNPTLEKRLKPFMRTCMHTQLGWGLNTKVAYCLGEGDNFKFLTAWNEEEKFFGEIIPLPHPRFIMQYKRRQLDKYIQLYLDRLH